MKFLKFNPWIGLALGIVCIAFSAIFVKIAGINGVSAAFYRVAIAACVLFPVYWFNHRSKFKVKEAILAFMCGFFFSSDVTMWYVSIMKTDATISTLLGNLAPLWTGVLGFFFFKAKPSKFYWIGTIIAITGVILLLGVQNVFHLKVNTGFFLAIAASVFYALYLLSSNKVRQSFETVPFMTFALLGSVCTSGVYCTLTHAPLWGFSLHAWLALFGMALISHLMGWLLINYSLGHIPSTEASLCLLSQSVLTGIIAAICLNETLSFVQIIGGFIVLAGIALVYVKRNRIPQTIIDAENS